MYQIKAYFHAVFTINHSKQLAILGHLKEYDNLMAFPIYVYL